MPKVPLILTGLLTLLAVVAGSYIAVSDALSHSEVIQAQIGVFATYGALVSATFVVYSYLQTNFAFVESQRPQLFLWVESMKGKEDTNSTTEFPVTRIHYKNVTANQFSDLTIGVRVDAANNSFNLDDLFQENMTMIGHDQRQRWFNTINELKNKGCDLNATTAAGTEVFLKLSYSFSFAGERRVVPCQRYKWDVLTNQWLIP